MRRIHFLTLLVLLSLLQGCVFLGGAAVGAGTAIAVYDHRSFSEIATDQKISYNVRNTLNEYPEILSNGEIYTTTFHRTVLLTGEVPNEHIKRQVTQLITEKIPEIKKLYNETTIDSASESISVETEDTLLTLKVKSRLLEKEGMASGDIKVVTNKGTVYLMGKVAQHHADQTVSIVRQIPGVKRVVKVFEYT